MAIIVRKIIPSGRLDSVPSSFFYDYGGDIAIVLSGVTKIVPHTKKSLIKINNRKTKARQVSENSDKLFNKVVDLKNGTDDIVINGWIDDEVENGTASSGGTTTLTDSTKSWVTNQYTGFSISIISGTGSGQTKIVSSNTGTIITVDSSWSTNPDSTSEYEVSLTAWEKYWKLRAMCTRGGPLAKFTLENIEFDSTTQEAFLEDVAGIINANDTGSIETITSDGVVRIEVTLSFFIGDER